jgi:beta-lactamase regulating signal transducer with metallopeptidase domain
MSEVITRVTVVMLLGLACLLVARRASSALRHWICFLSILASLGLPALMRWIPAWEIPLLSAAAPSASSTTSSWVADGALAVWSGGAFLLLVRVARRTRAAHRVCRSASRVAPAGWVTEAARIQRELGARRPVELRVRTDVDVPFAWGLLRPVVVLPAAAIGWGRGRRRAVLIHELAHVRRKDCWTNLLAEITCAVYWFHPLAWALAGQMRFEREAACDDRVLAAGARPSGYAALLLHAVRNARPGRLAMVPALGFQIGLERRIRSLLQKRRSRRVLSSDHHFWFAATAIALVLPIAAARPVPAKAASPAAMLVTDAPPVARPASPPSAPSEGARPAAPPEARRAVPRSSTKQVGSPVRRDPPPSETHGRHRWLLAFHLEIRIGNFDPHASR